MKKKIILVALLLVLSCFCTSCVQINVTNPSDAKTEKREKEASLFTVVAKGVFVMIAMGLVSLIKEYKDVVITYKNGNYVEIEGTVENYSTSLKDDIEYFTVDGVDFTCYEGEPFRYAKLKKIKL